jgi:hypothetical protein
VLRSAAPSRDPEVNERDPPLIRDEHVVRAHVSMDELEGAAVGVTQLVRVVQPLEQLPDDVERRALAQPGDAVRALIERKTIEELERQVLPAQLLPHLGRPHDVRVLQERHDPRLFSEHRAVL